VCRMCGCPRQLAANEVADLGSVPRVVRALFCPRQRHQGADGYVFNFCSVHRPIYSSARSSGRAENGGEKIKEAIPSRTFSAKDNSMPMARPCSAGAVRQQKYQVVAGTAGRVYKGGPGWAAGRLWRYRGVKASWGGGWWGGLGGVGDGGCEGGSCHSVS